MASLRSRSTNIINSYNTIRCYCTQKSKPSRNDMLTRRKELYDKEKQRQMSLITRIEKIQVDHIGVPEDCTLLMNKNMSTPFNCAMHIQEVLVNRSVLALVNGKPWDMHRPMVEDCQLQFLHFKDEDPTLSNEAFWRSCSFMLGYILETAFKDCHNVQLCSFPRPNVRSGSFVYDALLDIEDWEPTTAEMNCLSRIGARLQHQDIRFERLDVDASVALEMFSENKFKTEQIPSIASQSDSGSNITLYRMGDHIDISRGPLMSSTNLIQRYNVTALHDIESADFGRLKRVQGIAIPKQLPTHSWTYNFLSERAAQLNKTPAPRLYAPVAQASRLTNGQS